VNLALGLENVENPCLKAAELRNAYLFSVTVNDGE
jgi:hypothetical protein